jgi:hypothetical protein
MSEITSNEAADLMLQNLQNLLGEEVYDVIAARIRGHYLRKEMDMHKAMIHCPEIVEHALIDLLGQMGRIILVKICEDAMSKKILPFSTTGNLAKCMSIMTE